VSLGAAELQLRIGAHRSVRTRSVTSAGDSLTMITATLPSSALLGVLLGGSPEYLPHGTTQAGGRHLKLHETRTASPIGWSGHSSRIRAAVLGLLVPASSPPAIAPKG
jgi:hypothetical protein